MSSMKTVVKVAALIAAGVALAQDVPFSEPAQYKARLEQAETELREFDQLVVQPLIVQRDRLQEEYKHETERPPELRKQIADLEPEAAELTTDIEAAEPQIERLREQAVARMETVPAEADRAAEFEAQGLKKDARKARDRAKQARSGAKRLESKARDQERQLARKEAKLARTQAQLADLQEEWDGMVDNEPTPQQLQDALARLEGKLENLDQLRQEKQAELKLWQSVMELCREYNLLAGAGK